MKTTVDVNMLKFKILASGYSIATFSECIGISTQTLYNKLKKHGETFSVKEVYIICDKLNLSKKDAVSIFFADDVA